MLEVRYHNQFKRDYKAIKKRGYNTELLEKTISALINEETLSVEYRNHALSGNYKGFMECHIQPDWLLIYKIEKNILTLTLSRTGTHSDLFE